MKYITKFYWWLAFKLPPRLALYTFVRVHALSGDGPVSDGEYSKSYKRWVAEYEIRE